MDLISREAAIKELKIELATERPVIDVIGAVEKLPTIDAVPVVHGKWSLAFTEEENVWKCSNCDDYWLLNDGTPFDNGMNFCPKCGARMDGKKNEEVPVIVVRCKDCKHYHKDEGWCDKHSHFINSDGTACHPWESNDWKMFDDNDFCSGGERKVVRNEN